VSRHLRAEVTKVRTTRTTLGMTAALIGLVLVAIALHALGFPESSLSDRAAQRRTMIDVGENLGTIFGALSGSYAITAEIRYGTIRPTLLATPRRVQMLAAKTVSQLATGLLFGVLAAATAAIAGSVFLSARGISVHLRADDYVLLVVGGAAASALWAVIGLGLGTIVRSQVPVTVGILVWVLFVENLMRGGIPRVGRFAPGSLAQSIAGQTANTLRSPVAAGALLAAYTAAIAITAAVAFNRHDVT
jgi:ABC-2 type transport system permease protein